MEVSQITEKGAEYYFVYYVLYNESDLEVFRDPGEVESFVTENKKADDTFDIISIVRGKLVDIKPTKVETCWRITN